MTRKTTLLPVLLLATLLTPQLKADEGMWLPLLIERNRAEMQQLGFRLTSQDIYNPDSSSLKDAVVMFGSGCTGEVVSGQGLVFTNHHCGYSYIQRFSTLEHDYLTDGFWAGKFEDEIPCPGLQLRFMRYMEDVTDIIIGEIDDYLFQAVPEKERSDSITARIKRLIKSLPEGYEYRVEPFYYQTHYYLFAYEVCNDIRLVGAPPSNIGKFGGDTDNWMFPRHTGDFSVFRIYADSLNDPRAAYSPDNVPYTPRRWFQIDLKGYDEGDFTMVMGYPYRTQEYISSPAVEQILTQEDPMRIAARTTRLGIIKAAMEQDPKVRIQYSAKAASIANGWKKWQGEVMGLQTRNVLDSKLAYESVFQKWTGNKTEGKQFKRVLYFLKEAYKPYRLAEEQAILFQEHILAAEAVGFANRLKKLCEVSAGTDTTKTLEQALTEARRAAEIFYKDYDPQVDRRLFEEMLYRTLDDGTRVQVPVAGSTNFDIQKHAKLFYEKSLLTRPEAMTAFLASYSAKKRSTIERDPLYRYASEQYAFYRENTLPALRAAQADIDSLQRLYMKGQIILKNISNWEERNKEERHDKGLCNKASSGPLYPDANFTMRVTYGQVAGFTPSEEKGYIKPYTTVDGIMEKENPDIYDYVVEPKLKQLHAARDYGRYANAAGEMPVAFIGTNHTTGGNSGSPVLNADGRLIGINFDRNWEGTMSDIRYDANLCRNIMLDIRYCLFIIDKFAGAQRLIEELDIAE